MGRKLLNRSYEVLGIDQKIWMIQETGGYGESATGGLLPLADGAVEHISAALKFNIAREDSASRSGRSVTVRHSKKKEVSISMEGYIIPGIPDEDGNPTLPPFHPLFASAFGTVDVSDPTKIIYKLSRLNDKSFRIIEEASHYARLVSGCVMDKLTFTLPGDGKAMIKAEGFGQDSWDAGETTLARAITGSAVAAFLVVQALTYTAVATGQAGNAISIIYTSGASAGSEVVTVVDNQITIQIATGVSTATQIKTAFDAETDATDLATVAISGSGAATQVVAAEAFLHGGLGAFDIQVPSGKGPLFEVNAYIDTVDKDDGDTVKINGRKIASINGDYITLVSAGGALTASDLNDIVIGHAPSTFAPVSSENALLGLKGSITFAGVSVTTEVISAEVSIANNFTKKDFLYGTSKTTGYIPDKRRAVSLKLDILLNKDNFLFYKRNKNFVAEDVTLTLEPQDIPAPIFTTSVGRTFTFRMPKVEFNIPPIEQPGDKYVTLTLEGTVMAPDLDSLDEELELEIS